MFGVIAKGKPPTTGRVVGVESFNPQGLGFFIVHTVLDVIIVHTGLRRCACPLGFPLMALGVGALCTWVGAKRTWVGAKGAWIGPKGTSVAATGAWVGCGFSCRSWSRMTGLPSVPFALGAWCTGHLNHPNRFVGMDFWSY